MVETKRRLMSDDNSLKIDNERVDLLMKRANIKSYRALAEKANIHYNTVTNIMRGGTFDSNTARKLAWALNCNPIDLMTTKGFPDPNLETLVVR